VEVVAIRESRIAIR